MADRTVDYLIVGNSAAGVSAAEEIRKADEAGSVLIVGDEPCAVYGRPLISYLLEGKTSYGNIGWKEEGWYEAHRIETALGSDARVVALDAAAHTAELASGDAVSYGKCLIATGSVPFTPPIEGLAGRENVHTFFTLADAEGVWSDARRAQAEGAEQGRPTRAVVIGSGLIGLKAAEAVCGYVDEVLVLELADRILPAVLDGEGARLLQGMLEGHRIVCRPGLSADRLVGEGDRVTSVVLTNGETVKCDFVVAAVGVRPNSKLAVDAGAEAGRGLVCGPDLQTSLPDVYAAGDVVQVVDELDGGERPLALWPNAVQQGKCAGRHMASSPTAEPFEGSFAVNAVDFFETSLLTSGVINPPEDGGYDVRTECDGGSYVKFVTKDDRLYGYILLNRPDNAGIYTWMIKNGTPVSSLPDEAFARAVENLDFPEAARWARLHKFYPSDLDERGWKETA